MRLFSDEKEKSVKRQNDSAETPEKPQAVSLLHEVTLRYPQTEWWNDSCEIESLRRAVEQGATGATSNPVIVLEAISKNPEFWIGVIERLVKNNPALNEEGIAWKLVDEAVKRGADVLWPVFQATNGRQGWLCVQVNPRNYRLPQAMVHQALRLAKVRENVAIKIPATKAGIEAIERLTAMGVMTNATVSYTVQQALAVAEAVERGLSSKGCGLKELDRRPWTTLMVGRIEDHVKDEIALRGVQPPWLQYGLPATDAAGPAVFKKAYRIYERRGYRSKLLAAAMRGPHHFAPFIGGDCVITIPPKWQDVFNAYTFQGSITESINNSVHSEAVEWLRTNVSDFTTAMGEGLLAHQDFEHYGASKKTLHQFISGYEDLLRFVRGVMIPLR